MVQGAPAVMLQGEPADTLVVEAASNTPVTSLGTSLLRADGGYGMGIYNETATYTFTVPKTVAPANIVSTNTTTSRFKPGHTVASGIFAGTYITTITYTLENAP